MSSHQVCSNHPSLSLPRLCATPPPPHTHTHTHPPSTGEAQPAPSIPTTDLRWRAAPLKLDRWRDWFDQQLSLAKSAVSDNGLYVGLRLDGRVRASGMGVPPWARFAAELAPLEGERRGRSWGWCPSKTTPNLVRAFGLRRLWAFRAAQTA
jgi:hypothetical protein